MANRGMGIVQAFLLPGIVLKMIFKRPPKFTFRQLLLKTNVYLMIGVWIALKMWK
jgi:hypothetical protein